jgi:DNA-binding CsgD family transcriptional regulator
MKTHDHLKYQPGMALCPREGEALILAALGHSTKESARIMRIAACTVKAHLDSARVKLNARNIAHAISLAWEYGLLTSKYICVVFLIICSLSAGIQNNTDLRSNGRMVRTRSGGRKRDTELAFLPPDISAQGAEPAQEYQYMPAKQWWTLIKSARSAAA